ncbi:MAG: hypothetical protein HY607_00170 [Planctomycetes bacterium]|nr:hypothetical protein [Planctomycetota bacterium]
MPITFSVKNKNLANNLFASIFIPYLLLCLTVGGFHDSIFSVRHCNHTQESLSHSADDQQIRISGNPSQHNSETCQICQWLKTPSNLKQFLLHDMRFDCIYINLVCHSNPILPSIFIQRFTIRPPPAFSCISIYT